MKDNNKICGTCKWSKFDEVWREYNCTNEDSDNYAVETEYDGTCEEWRGKGIKPCKGIIPQKK